MSNTISQWQNKKKTCLSSVLCGKTVLFSLILIAVRDLTLQINWKIEFFFFLQYNIFICYLGNFKQSTWFPISARFTLPPSHPPIPPHLPTYPTIQTNNQTKSKLCCPYMYWIILKLPGTSPLKKTESPHPALTPVKMWR